MQFMVPKTGSEELDGWICQFTLTGTQNNDLFTCTDHNFLTNTSDPTTDTLDSVWGVDEKITREYYTENGVQYVNLGAHILRNYNTEDENDYVITDGEVLPIYYEWGYTWNGAH